MSHPPCYWVGHLPLFSLSPSSSPSSSPHLSLHLYLRTLMSPFLSFPSPFSHFPSFIKDNSAVPFLFSFLRTPSPSPQLLLPLFKILTPPSPSPSLFFFFFPSLYFSRHLHLPYLFPFPVFSLHPPFSFFLLSTSLFLLPLLPSFLLLLLPTLLPSPSPTNRRVTRRLTQINRKRNRQKKLRMGDRERINRPRNR